jgi:LmbE family N-acetylglucosaminyl deacetylase
MGAGECVVLDHPDGELKSDESTHLEMCDRIRALKPDIILTHWRGSFHRDHRAAYSIVMEGAFLAALPGIQRSDPAHLVKGLYYLENWEDLEDYHPDLWIDVTDVFDRWVHACREHQLLRGEVSFSYLHYYAGLAAKRGAEIGVQYAVTVSLPPISRKRKVDMLPVDTEPVLIF